MRIGNSAIALLIFTQVFIGLYSCSQSEGEILQPDGFYIPTGWPYPQYDFSNNTITNEGFELGKKLFFDPVLSRDSTISCGSCHLQEFAFSDSPNAVSVGIDGLTGNRNSPGLFNLVWQPDFMWDGGVNHIEIQPLAPITNPLEMDETMLNVVAKLNLNPVYKNEFLAVFGTDSVTSQLVFKALTQFMGSMVSANSKYDKVKNNVAGIKFTQEEQEGYLLFQENCSSCHTEPLFTDFSIRNNGLPLNPLYNDPGRYLITFNPADSMKFKIPSLRNVMVTAPYMHDGRFTTIDQVLDHYSSGIVHYNNLATELNDGIILNNVEREKIKLFLYTLTDYSFLNNPKFKP